ncbi:MAG: deoxyribonuclease IV [Planctomycetota bacterium]|jgi:deoxyribonuclease-4
MDQTPRARRIGFHVSIEGGLPRAVDRALERGCTAVQVFCGNPRGWRLQERDDEEIQRFRAARSEADLRPLFVHSCYLINPCSQDAAVLRKSIDRLTAELDLAGRMGADGYVLHPGSHKGKGAAWGIERAAAAIGTALQAARGAPALLLEGMAGPHGPGGNFGALGRLIRRLKRACPDAAVGVAADSCHVFGAGYDLRAPAEVDRLVGEIDEAAGLAALHLLHLNDSRDQPGSGRDRHAHIGRGNIGEGGLRNLLLHPALAHLPLILESPWESVEADRRNLRVALRLVAPG